MAKPVLQTSAGSFFELSMTSLTNKVVCEVFKLMSGKKKIKDVSWRDISSKLLQVFDGTEFGEGVVRRSFQMVKDKRASLLKNSKGDGKRRLEEFLASLYIPPTRSGKHLKRNLSLSNNDDPITSANEVHLDEQGVTKVTLVKVVKENSDLGIELEQLKGQIVGLSGETESLQNDLVALQSSKDATLKRLNEVYSVIGKVDGQPKHVMQAFRRKCQQAEHWRSEAIRLRKALKLQKCTSSSCAEKSKELKRLRQRISNRNWRAKKQKANAKKIPQVNTELLTETLRSTLKKVKDQMQEITHLENENCILQERLNSDHI